MRRYLRKYFNSKFINLFIHKKQKIMAHLDETTTPVVFKVTGEEVLGDVDREVMKVTYSFNQAVDKEGQMTGIVRGGNITVRVKALNDGNTHLLNWMLKSDMHKAGEIVFVETMTRQTMKTIKFRYAYCVDYHDVWEDRTGDGDLGHYEEFTLSCQDIEVVGKVGSAKFHNNWK